MSEQLPDLTTRLRVDTTDLEAATRRGATFGAAIGSAIGGLATGAISAGIGKVTSFVTGAVDAFAELEDATAAAGVVFGSSVGDITKFAKNAADTAGLSAAEATNAALTFGTMGKSAGLQGKPLAGFSTEMAQLAGDMASFRGTSPEQAIEAVGAALRGETEPIRQYGVLLDDASLRQEAVRQGLIKTTKEALTPQQKVLAAHALILKQTSDAQGDFARTSDSTANVQKRLAAESANTQAELGQKLAPAMTALRQILLDSIVVVTALIGAITPLVAGFAAMVGFIRANIDVLGPLAAVIATVAVVANASAIATTAVTAAQRVAAAATKAWAVVQGVLNAVMSANPLGLLVVAIAVLVAAVVLAYRHSETFREIVQAAWQVVQRVIGAVVPAVLGFIHALVGGVRDAWGAIRDATTAIWGRVRDVIETVVGWITGFVEREVAGLVAIWHGVTAVVGVVRDAFNSAREAVADRIGALLDLVRGIDDRVRSALGNLGSALLQAGRDLIQGLIDGILDKLDAVRGAVGKVADVVGKFWPGSPIEEGPLRSWNNGGAGKALGDLLAAGLLASTGTVGAAAAQLAGAVRTPLAGGPAVLAPFPAGAAGPAVGGGTSWAPTVQVQGVVTDPGAVAGAAIDELTWQARLAGATL